MFQKQKGGRRRSRLFTWMMILCLLLVQMPIDRAFAATINIGAPDISTGNPYKVDVLKTDGIIVTFDQDVKIEQVSGIKLLKQGTTTPLPITPAVQSSDEKQIKITSAMELDFGADYDIKFEANSISKKADGTLLDTDLTATFHTADELQVLAAGTTPTANVKLTDPIKVKFNSVLDNSAITTSKITLKKGSSPNIGNATLSGSGDEITITPTIPLEYDTTYTVTVPKDAVIGTSKQTLKSDYTLNFKTVEGLKVEETTPGNNEKDVMVDSKISITFNKALKPGTESNITVTGGTVPVTVTPALKDGNKRVELTLSKLEYNTPYILKIPKTVVAIDDATLEMERNIPFTTTPELKADLTKAVPANNAIGVPIDTRISIPFNKDIEIEDVSKIQLKDKSGANVTLKLPEVSGSTLILTPYSQLKLSEEYEVIVQAGAVRYKGTTQKLEQNLPTYKFKTAESYGAVLTDSAALEKLLKDYAPININVNVPKRYISNITVIHNKGGSMSGSTVPALTTLDITVDKDVKSVQVGSQEAYKGKSGNTFNVGFTGKGDGATFSVTAYDQYGRELETQSVKLVTEKDKDGVEKAISKKVYAYKYKNAGKTYTLYDLITKDNLLTSIFLDDQFMMDEISIAPKQK
jgi:hypothetical protein